MTVTEMQTYVAQILADTSNTKWQNSTHILPSLNNAQEELVLRIASYASKNRRAFELLGEIEKKSSTLSVASTGYALSGLDTAGPYMRNGFVACSCTIDETTKWCQYIPSADLEQQSNYYLKGSDDMPLCYTFNETLYILASTGTYPISAILYYIREPKTLVASGATGYQVTTCELNALFHRLICEMAAANCWRMMGDESSLRKYDNIMKRIEMKIQSIAMGGLLAPKIVEEGV